MPLADFDMTDVPGLEIQKKPGDLSLLAPALQARQLVPGLLDDPPASANAAGSEFPAMASSGADQKQAFRFGQVAEKTGALKMFQPVNQAASPPKGKSTKRKRSLPADRYDSIHPGFHEALGIANIV